MSMPEFHSILAVQQKQHHGLQEKLPQMSFWAKLTHAGVSAKQKLVKRRN